MASDNKYDRQIRLWGPHGQKILSSSRILLLGASGSGSETLKNLILPGIKHFTIVDNEKVTERDLGQNFFLTRDSIGQSRAQVMYENLLELNPDDVAGEAIEMGVEEFVKQPDPADGSTWASRYDLVIGTDLSNDLASAVSLRVRAGQNAIPFVLLRQYGLIGYIRSDVDELCVAEQKEYQKEFTDLRMNQPFEGLLEFVKGFDMDNLCPAGSTPEEVLAKHSHVPYVIVLFKAAEKWKSEHDGSMPKTFDEKKQFKDVIKSLAIDYSKELNFEEAIKKSFLMFQSPDYPDVMEVLESPKITDSRVKRPFWVFAAALKRFYDQHKALPVSGTIPDMTSHTDYYLGLQQVYIKKAEEDYQTMLGLVGEIVKERGLTQSEYSEDELRIFCKNATTLHVTKMKALHEELKEELSVPEEFQWELHDDESCNRWYLACKAMEEYRQEHGVLPGLKSKEQDSTQYEQELAALQGKMDAYASKITPDQKISDKFIKELMRFSDSKVHTISAFLGGVASQEIIKILIKQYTIFNNTLIYDGIHGRCQTFGTE